MQARQQGNTTVHRIHEKSVAASQFLVAIAYPSSTWCRTLLPTITGCKAVAQKSVALARHRGTVDPAIAGLPHLQAQFLWVMMKPLCQQGLNLHGTTLVSDPYEVALADLLREQNQLEAAAQHLTQN